jgi:predicted polyphosphate/ATP-dependent NAD kinase
MRIGLIVNPIAGIGGRVGLKGSDGANTQKMAFALGAEPLSNLRAAITLEVLTKVHVTFELFTPPGQMGENVARQCGFAPHVIGMLSSGSTSAQDTRRIAQAMLNIPVELLLFAGGDGTARDIYNAVNTKLPVLGIPAGVKIHSAVFATNPRHSAEIATAYLLGEKIVLRESEVVDLDEDAYRTGIFTTRLFGYLNVPYRPHLVQNSKVPTPAAESARVEAIAADVIENMQAGWFYILGPGTTTRAITQQLGFPKTLVGVDVYTKEGVVALDVNESRLLSLLRNQPAKIIVTPIGGQGFLFGRGNQQISPKVIQKIGRENIIVVSLVEKLNALQGEPLLVDTGEREVDNLLVGYLPVITGYHEKVVYRIAS